MAKAKAKEEEAAPVSFDETGADSDSYVVDLSGVDDYGEFEVMPRGTYNCQIASLDYDLSQSSGQPMWTTQLEVEDGEYQGRKLFTHISFSEKALPRTKMTIARIAPQLLEGPFSPETVADEGTLLGVRCRAQVKIERYENKPRNKVSNILEPVEGGGDAFL